MGRVVGLVFVCALLSCLPSLSLQRSLHEASDGEGFEPSPMFKWTGLGARAAEVVLDDHGDEPWEPPHFGDEPPPSPPPHHHSPPPPSPPPPHSPPPPSPPPPSPPPPPPSPPPPPPPLAFLKDLQVSDGDLKPKFHPDVYHYNSTVGEKVSKVSVTATVFPEIKDYEIEVNFVKLKSGEPSPPIPIGSNGETVEFYITVGAHGYTTNTYFLSIYRNKKTSIWWSILKWFLTVMLALLVLVLILLCCDRFFPQLRAYRWWPFGPRGGRYESVNPDPSPLVAERGV